MVKKTVKFRSYVQKCLTPDAHEFDIPSGIVRFMTSHSGRRTNAGCC